MKNIYILMSVVVLSAGLRAQYSDYYYHRVGDTVEWKAPNGYYSWWELEHYYENNMMFTWIGMCIGTLCVDSAIVLQRYYTPTPLKIIGVAGHCWYPQNLGQGDSSYRDYFLIYDAEPDSFPLKAQVRWNPQDPCRYLHFKYHGFISTYQTSNGDTCCAYNPYERYLPLYEYYFDTAVYVTDSFYVGGTHYHQPYYTAFSTYSGSASCDREYQGGFRCTPTDLVMKELAHAILTNCGHDSIGWQEWHWLDGNTQREQSTYFLPNAQALAIYPIVEMDTTVPPEGLCLPVTNLCVPLTDSGCATVTWDWFPNYTRLTLQYGPVNVPPAGWTTVDVTGQTLHRLSGLTLHAYGVRLRAECDKKDMGWSEPVTFYNQYDPGVSVPEGDGLLSTQTRLSPNPATGSVWVSSIYGLKRIELYNASGLLVLSAPVSGHGVNVSLEGLPAGHYVAAIVTHNGTTHKKLVIQ